MEPRVKIDKVVVDFHFLFYTYNMKNLAQIPTILRWSAASLIPSTMNMKSYC